MGGHCLGILCIFQFRWRGFLDMWIFPPLVLPLVGLCTVYRDLNPSRSAMPELVFRSAVDFTQVFEFDADAGLTRTG